MLEKHKRVKHNEMHALQNSKEDNMKDRMLLHQDEHSIIAEDKLHQLHQSSKDGLSACDHSLTIQLLIND